MFQKGHLLGVYIVDPSRVENGSEFDFDVSALKPPVAAGIATLRRQCWSGSRHLN